MKQPDRKSTVSPLVSQYSLIFPWPLTSHSILTLTPDVRYVAEHSRCNVMVVEDEEQLNKVENIQDMLPELQAIIQYTGFPRSVTL